MRAGGSLCRCSARFDGRVYPLRAVLVGEPGDIEGFLADATDDFEFTLRGTPPSGSTLRGKQAMIELLKTLFGEKLERSAIAMTIENMIAEGDYVAEQSRGKARTLDGQDYNNVYCRVWRFRDGKDRGAYRIHGYGARAALSRLPSDTSPTGLEPLPTCSDPLGFLTGLDHRRCVG